MRGRYWVWGLALAAVGGGALTYKPLRHKVKTKLASQETLQRRQARGEGGAAEKSYAFSSLVGPSAWSILTSGEFVRGVLEGQTLSQLNIRPFSPAQLHQAIWGHVDGATYALEAKKSGSGKQSSLKNGQIPAIVQVVYDGSALSGQEELGLQQTFQGLAQGVQKILWVLGGSNTSLSQDLRDRLVKTGVQVKALAEDDVGSVAWRVIQYALANKKQAQASRIARWALLGRSGGIVLDSRAQVSTARALASAGGITGKCAPFSLVLGIDGRQTDSCCDFWMAARPGHPLVVGAVERAVASLDQHAFLRTQMTNAGKTLDMIEQVLRAQTLSYVAHAVPKKVLRPEAKMPAPQDLDSKNPKNKAFIHQPPLPQEEESDDIWLACPVGPHRVVRARPDSKPPQPVKDKASFEAYLASMPQYPLPPSIFSGHNALFAEPIVFSDADPTWDFDPVLYAKYTGDLSVKTQQEWANLPPGVTVGSQRRPAQGKTPVIVSLTSWPPRIRYTWLAIESIMRQRVKPDRIILNLAEDEFRGKNLPKTLRMLQKRGLEIRYGPNLFPGKKLLPLQKEHQDHIIVTVDDDVYYPDGRLEKLYAAHQSDPAAVWCTCQNSTQKNLDNRLLPSYYWVFVPEDVQRKMQKPWFKNVRLSVSLLAGCCGILYPPRSLPNEIWDQKLFLKMAAKNDDIWIPFHIQKKGTSIKHLYTYDAWPWRALSCIELDISSACALSAELLKGIKAFNFWWLTDRDLHNLFTHYGLYKRFGLKPMVPGAVLNDRGELEGPSGQSLKDWQKELAQ
jgi:hypothetical protein